MTAQTPLGPEVPEGWKLVPLVPTQEMLDALHDAIGHDVQTGLYLGDDPSADKYAEVSVLHTETLPDAYRDMLDAAPAPPFQATNGSGS